MTEIVLALVVFGTAVAAMAVGVILSNRRIQGSCGGLANLRDEQGEVTCPVCGDPSESCGGEEDGLRRAAEREEDPAPARDERSAPERAPAVRAQISRLSR